MPIRTVRDSQGVAWRVWDVRPDALPRDTASSRFLADFAHGWLCFESEAEKRRLTPFPPDWHRASDDELERLRHRAQVVSRRHLGETTGEFRRRSDRQLPGSTLERESLRSERTFAMPSGRVWTVRLVRAPGDVAGVARTVLRFETDDLALELDEWPHDWALRSDAELAEMARLARPPRLRRDDEPLRRRSRP